MTSCRIETGDLNGESIVVAAISQWRRRLSACVCVHGGHLELIHSFMVQFAKLVLSKFHAFVVFHRLTVLLVAKM